MGTLEGYVEGMINLSGGGGGGTSDYEELENKPSINNVTLSGNKTTSDLNLSYNDLLNKPYINNMPPSTGADIGDVLTHTSDGDGWEAPEKELPVISAADEGKILKIINGAPTWVSASGGYSEAILFQNSSGMSFNSASPIDITLSDNMMNYKFLAIEFSTNEVTPYRNISIIPTSMIDQSGTNGFCSTIVGGNAGFAPVVNYAGNNLLHFASWGRTYTLLLYKIVGINF